MTWNEAEIFCNNIDTNLASIYSSRDYEELTFLCSMYTTNCWIGLVYDVGSDEYHWVDQTQFQDQIAVGMDIDLTDGEYVVYHTVLNMSCLCYLRIMKSILCVICRQSCV